MNEDPNARLRLLECWLPLVQQMNREYEWGLDAPPLEALIIRVAYELNQAESVDDARAILYFHHYRFREMYR